ncbi:MAG: M23 family metallopeptidase [Fidelibacterota bacterium]
MKPNRYTFLVIPDSGDENKQFRVSRRFLQAILITGIVLALAVLGLIIYFTPQVVNYGSLKTKYDRLARERMSVLNLMQDLERIQQMDQQIRKTLGPDLQFNSSVEAGDSTAARRIPGIVNEKHIRVSYVENIPSLPPTMGYVTQRMHTSIQDPVKNHYGIDIAVKEGDPVVASASGYVVFSGWTYDLGNLVILFHGNGYFTIYGHFLRSLVINREFVHRGEVIGLAGDTGISSGPHLHFEIWKDGLSLDPFIYFPEYQQKDISRDENE